MKILVFDDNQTHLAAARLQLKDHDVTIVSTYEEAVMAFKPKTDYTQADRLLAEAGWAKQPDQKAPREEHNAWYEARKKSFADATTEPTKFDVVMTDLLVPAPETSLGPKGYKYIGQEMPIGTSIAFLALSKGVKRVAVVTDTNHHDHPASATFDDFAEGKDGIRIGDTKILLLNENVIAHADKETLEVRTYNYLNSPEGKEKYPPAQDGWSKALVRVKTWDRVLEKLLQD
jgi:CheY-like chemotaxis protein